MADGTQMTDGAHGWALREPLPMERLLDRARDMTAWLNLAETPSPLHLQRAQATVAVLEHWCRIHRLSDHPLRAEAMSSVHYLTEALNVAYRRALQVN